MAPLFSFSIVLLLEPVLILSFTCGRLLLKMFRQSNKNSYSDVTDAPIYIVPVSASIVRRTSSSPFVSWLYAALTYSYSVFPS